MKNFEKKISKFDQKINLKFFIFKALWALIKQNTIVLYQLAVISKQIKLQKGDKTYFVDFQDGLK